MDLYASVTLLLYTFSTKHQAKTLSEAEEELKAWNKVNTPKCEAATTQAGYVSSSALVYFRT